MVLYIKEQVLFVKMIVVFLNPIVAFFYNLIYILKTILSLAPLDSPDMQLQFGV